MLARLPILARVLRCCASSSFFLISRTWISTFSASFHLPWFLYVLARFIILVRVLGCSSPSTFFLMSITSQRQHTKLWSLSSDRPMHGRWCHSEHAEHLIVGMDSLISAKEVNRQSCSCRCGLTFTTTDTGEYFCVFYYFLTDGAYLMWGGSEMGDDSTARNVGS